jgi:hypothetical protein
MRAGGLDRLVLNLCPEISGGGAYLFADGLPTTSWTLTDMATSDTGSIFLTYDKAAERP